MTTISKEKTFAFQESELLKKGFKAEVLDPRISRFKSPTQYAFITLLNNGEGFKTEIYNFS